MFAVGKILTIGFMIIISVTDIKKQKIPDCYIMILLCLSAFINDIPPLERLFGLMISLPLTLYSCKTNRLGGGDIKLAASMGWCVGIGYTALSYFLAQTVFVLSTFHQNNRKFPFAPYICGAFSVILVISEFI